MKAVLAILLLIASISQIYCSEDDVLVLTDSNFKSTVDDLDLVLVEFYAPWCGHCKSLAPKYAEAAGILKKSDPEVKLAKVDCTVETSVASQYGISGYPTLKVFRNGVASDYKGGRETESIVSFMRKNSGPSAKILADIADAKKYITRAGDVNIVGYFPTKNTVHDTFHKLADELREQFRFGTVTDKSVAESLGLKEGVSMFRSEKDHSFFDGVGDLKDWVYEEVIKHPGEITKDNMERYLRKKLPIVKLYTDVNWGSNVKQTTYWLNRLKKLAEEYSGKLLFTIADKVHHAEDAAKFGITKYPALVVDDVVNSARYRHEGEFGVKEGLAFLADYAAGKLKSYIKSEPTPVQDGPVTIVTGENFKDIVLDDTKDVLLEMYAPWCGHCKNLVPVYDELATNLKGVDNIVIAKMDATANDSPHSAYSAKGYPTILFAPAGNKNSPVAYSGARDVKSFTDFLKKEAKNSDFKNVSGKSEL